MEIFKEGPKTQNGGNKTPEAPNIHVARGHRLESFRRGAAAGRAELKGDRDKKRSEQALANVQDKLAEAYDPRKQK